MLHFVYGTNCPLIFASSSDTAFEHILNQCTSIHSLHSFIHVVRVCERLCATLQTKVTVRYAKVISFRTPTIPSRGSIPLDPTWGSAQYPLHPPLPRISGSAPAHADAEMCPPVLVSLNVGLPLKVEVDSIQCPTFAFEYLISVTRQYNKSQSTL